MTMSNLTSHNICCIWNAIRRLDVDNKQQGTSRLFNATRHCFSQQMSQNRHRDILRFLFTNETFEDGILCSNEYGRQYRNKTTSRIFLVVWALMIIVIVLGNTLLIAAILKSKSLRRTVANLFVLSLSASDLCVGLFVLPFKLNQGINDMRFTLGLNWCRVYITADHTFFVIAITHLLAISLDRYIALIYPYRYPSLTMQPWYKRSIATIWIYGFLWGSITTLSMINENNSSTKSIKVDQEICTITMEKYYVVAVFVLVFFIPMITMGYTYIRLLIIARRHALAIRAVSKSFLHDSPHVHPKVKMIHNQHHHHDLPVGEQRLRVPSSSEFQSPLLVVRDKQLRSSFNGHLPNSRSSSNGSNHHHNKTPMQEYRKTIFKASKTIVVVYGTFVVAWTPVCVITLILSLCRHCLATSSTSSKWHYNLFIEVFPFMSSMLNPFIYGVMNKQYRRAFRSILESYHMLKPRHGSLSNKDYLSGSPYNSSVL